eukprot:3139997-Pyramimonas_sp.AAC.1
MEAKEKAFLIFKEQAAIHKAELETKLDELSTVFERVRRRSRVRLVRRGNIPTRPASDWSVVGIYPRVLRPMGP